MKNTIDITVRDFTVTVRDERTCALRADSIILTKKQLQAAALVGMDSKELIYRIYNRQGYRVQKIAPAVKRKLTVALYEAPGEIVIEGKAMLTGDEVYRDV